MKVLHVISSMDPESGGPCAGIRNVDRVLEVRGIHREVASLDDPSASFIGMDAFPLHPLGPGKGPMRYSARMARWLDEHLGRFDVVVINGLWQYHSYAVYKAMKRLKERAARNGHATNVPRVYTMPHGMLDPYFQRAPERKLKAVRNWVYWKLFEADVVNASDGLLFTCEAELQLAREPFRPYRPRREVNVGYGVHQPEPFNENMRRAFLEKCPEAEGRPFLLFLSRIHHKKGVDLLVQAYAALAVEARVTGAELPLLVIAGPGLDTPFGKKVFDFVASDRQLQQQVLFPGMLSGDAKWGAFYGCEAFVLPSHQENFGIAIVEALACSRPVLISKQVNIWQEIEQGGGGLVATDTEAGATRLLKSWLSLSDAAKATMGRNAFAVYSRHFSIAQASDLFLEALKA